MTEPPLTLRTAPIAIVAGLVWPLLPVAAVLILIGRRIDV